MNVLIFGATGMVGQGVLRECLLDAGVEGVVTIGRSASGAAHPKVRQIVHADLLDYSGIESQITNLDACFFCLGVSSNGMSEADYKRVTYGIAIAAANTLVRLNPRMTFIYVSGAGADSSEKGRAMWARIKGKAENALIRMPFRAAYAFRPGMIQPLDGIRSRTSLYNVLYTLFRPIVPVLRWAFPNQVLTTREIGQAMLKAVRLGAPKRVLESADIHELAVRS